MNYFAHLCRLCLATEKNRVDLFKGRDSSKYSKQLEEVFQIELQDIPSWPQTACSTCIQKIRDVVEFKATIASSQEKLAQLLANTQVKCEPVHVEEYNCPLGLKIVSVVSIKEELFGNGEGDLENSSRDDDLESSEEDDDTEDEDHKMELRLGKPKEIKKHTQTDPRIEKMFRDLNVLQCSSCNKNFTSLSDLSSHQWRVHNQNNVIITCCGLKVQSRVECYDHMQYHLNKDAFKCEECGKRCLSGRKLKRHKDQVHATTRFKCKKCRKEFKTSSKLRRHSKTHLDPGERPYKCTKCGKGFLQSNHLSGHLISAHAQRTKCTICAKEVVDMDFHKRKSHPTVDQLVKCGVCKKKMSAISLRTHMKENHREGGFLCATCGKKLLTQFKLYKHKKNNCDRRQ